LRTAFIKTLIKIAAEDERIFLITPDMGFSVFEEYIRLYPDRFLNVGISEQNAIGVAAGLSFCDFVPFVYSIIPFVTLRCLEQIKIDIAYAQMNVKIVGVGAGFSYGPAGSSHHAIEDIGVMRSIPGITICCPGDPYEVKKLIEQGVNTKDPIYFRLGKGGEPVLHKENDPILIGKAAIIREGNDFALISTSNSLETAIKWADEIAKKGKTACIVSMHTIKPVDKDVIISLIDRNIPIFTIEEHNIIGGLGSAVSEIIAEYGKPVRFKRIGVYDEYTHEIGSQAFLRKKSGLNDFDATLFGIF
jgi:transketolase